MSKGAVLFYGGLLAIPAVILLVFFLIRALGI